MYNDKIHHFQNIYLIDNLKILLLGVSILNNYVQSFTVLNFCSKNSNVVYEKSSYKAITWWVYICRKLRIMVHYKLYYFDVRGWAEISRQVFFKDKLLNLLYFSSKYLEKNLFNFLALLVFYFLHNSKNS